MHFALLYNVHPSRSREVKKHGRLTNTEIQNIITKGRKHFEMPVHNETCMYNTKKKHFTAIGDATW
jgi:hypothetical protein